MTHGLTVHFQLHDVRSKISPVILNYSSPSTVNISSTEGPLSGPGGKAKVVHYCVNVQVAATVESKKSIF